MWVLKDRLSERYVVIPIRYPGRGIRFFMKEEDAESLTLLLEANTQLKDEDVVPFKVKLEPAIRAIASDFPAVMLDRDQRSARSGAQYQRDARPRRAVRAKCASSTCAGPSRATSPRCRGKCPCRPLTRPAIKAS